MSTSRTENLKSYLFRAGISGIVTGFFTYFVFQSDWRSYFLGVLIGVQVYSFIHIYIMWLEQRINQYNFVLSLLISTFLYMLFIMFSVLSSLLIINKFNLLIFQEETLKSIFFSVHMLYGVLFGLTMSFIFNLFSMFNTLLGKNFLFKLFTGKYHKPFEEERVFMFLDIKSSTSIAEKIGHKKFLSLLNDFFYDLSVPVIATKGEIYKYVGDEAIISWKMKSAMADSNPLRCFFMLQELVQKNGEKYLKHYGVIPQFKAGVHGGMVVTGEMGYIKKEITFLGDVLNTTARIEETCKEFNQALIVSDEMLRKMNPGQEYLIQSLGEIKFRGKEIPVSISSVESNHFSGVK
jgi:adenylate cyclase